MARLSSEAFTSGRVIALADIPVRIETADRDQSDVVLELLGVAPDESRAPLIDVRWGHERIATPDEPSGHPFDLDVWHDDRGVTLRYEDLTARVEQSRLLIGGACEDLRIGFRRVFEPAITYLLAPFDRYMLHGCAVGREGQAFLVLGESGSGKSTLAWAAVQAGWDLLADDHIIVRPDGDGYEVCGIPKPPTVPAEVMRDPPTGARVFERAGRERWEIPATVLTEGWQRVQGVLIPRHGTTDEGALAPADTQELLRLIVGSFAAIGHRDLLRRFFPHAAALTRLPARELLHSRDPAVRLRAAARWLDVARASA